MSKLVKVRRVFSCNWRPGFAIQPRKSPDTSDGLNHRTSPYFSSPAGAAGRARFLASEPA